MVWDGGKFEDTTTLPLTSTKAYRMHVNKDLQPYVCISKDCSEDWQFFATYQGWHHHMSTTHSPSWIQYLYNKVSWGYPLDSCGSESVSYESKNQLIEEHMLKAHCDIHEAELRRTANNSEVSQPCPVDRCPLCGHQVERYPTMAPEVQPGYHGGKNNTVRFISGESGEPGEDDNGAVPKVQQTYPHYSTMMRHIGSHMLSLAIFFASSLVVSDLDSTREVTSNEVTSNEITSHSVEPRSSLNLTDFADSSSLAMSDQYDIEEPPLAIDHDSPEIPLTENDHWDQILER